MSTPRGRNSSATGTVDLVGHVVIGVPEIASPTDVKNIIIAAKTGKGRWVETFTSQIGLARARFQSTYLHWAMAINGLFVAAARYESDEWQSKNECFYVTAVRPPDPRAILVRWAGDYAAEVHRLTVPKMAAWGYIELYSVLEASIFDFFRAYWEQYPDGLLRGKEFRRHRALMRAATAEGAGENELAAWREAWVDRLNDWHRKKLYDGLHKVLLAFCAEAGLKTPSVFTKTTIETWAQTVEGLGLLRHLLIHGEHVVPDILEEFCAKPHSMSFTFKAGDPLRVDLTHLQAFELFTHQLLAGLNRSALEHPDAGT